MKLTRTDVYIGLGFLLAFPLMMTLTTGAHAPVTGRAATGPP